MIDLRLQTKTQAQGFSLRNIIIWIRIYGRIVGFNRQDL